MEKKVLVCGAGTIGIYLGAKLFSRGNDVKLFGRRKLRAFGDFVTISGRKYKMPEKIFQLPYNEKFDFIFITSKLYDFEGMIRIIKKHKLSAGHIVSIQNGLVDSRAYEKLIGKIIPITVFSGLNIDGNEIKVMNTSMGWKTENSNGGKAVSKLLLDAGIPCHAASNFNSLRAEKTIVNSCLNALSAIENKRFCDLFKNKKTKERIEGLFKECYSVLEKEYKLDGAEKMKKRMIKNWAKLKHYSSTCQDLKSGRKIETKFFNGFIINLAKKYDLPFTRNLEILREIRKIVK